VTERGKYAGQDDDARPGAQAMVGDVIAGSAMKGFSKPGFLPVYLRNLLVWRRLARASLLANIADPLIMLIAFGYGLGSLIPDVKGIPYIVYLAGGTVCMSAAMSASFESLYSAFSRMHVQRTWEAIINTPVRLSDVLMAEWLWAASKASFSGLAILIVIFVLGLSREPTMLLAIPVIMLAGLVFAGIGLCFNALAQGYDFFTYYFTLFLTPMIFVSGTYYPVEQLPDWLGRISAVLPLTAAVELARPLVLGRMPENSLTNLLLLTAYAGGAYLLALRLTLRRFNT
jgi:lipooligosaccharide transport system permease protein